jgi:hypothetical protein
MTAATYHRYPFRALAGDYVRAALGLALVLLPLAVVPLNRWITVLFAVLAALFAAFAVRTALRQASPVEMTEEAIIAQGPFPRRLDWSRLDRVTLGYYATRRDGANGWMQLGLAAGGRRLKLDSRIDGFAAIAERAARAARRRQLALAPSTAANFAAMGLDMDSGIRREA